MSRRVLIYCRQSDSDGEGEHSLSLDSQSSVLRADAARLGWTVVAELRDPDLKGADDQRPGLLELYARCRARDVDLVAFWNLERLARSVRITENVVYELERLGVALYSNQEPWITDFPFLRQVLAAAAEHQTRVISGHVRRTLRENARRGFFQGHIPYGYQRGEQRRLEPSEHADTVRVLFTRYADGASIAELIYDLDRRGIPSPTGRPRWSHNVLAELLANPVYRGVLRFRDLVQDGAHPALIDDETWQRAQQRHELRPRAPRMRETGAGSWLEGLVFHVCGRPLYWNHHRDRRPRLRCIGQSQQRIPCTIRPLSMTATTLEDRAWEIIVAQVRAIDALPIEQIIRDTRRRYDAASPTSARAHQDALTRQRRVETRRERILESYWSDAIDRSRCDAELAVVRAELAEIEGALRELPNPPDPIEINRRYEALCGWAVHLDAMTAPQARRALLQSLGSIVLGPDGVMLQMHRSYADFRPLSVDKRG